MKSDGSSFTKALTPVCVPASKTAEFLRRFEADLPHRGTCPVAGCDPQSSAWVSGISRKVPSGTF